jgi:hypothetical protein
MDKTIGVLSFAVRLRDDYCPAALECALTKPISSADVGGAFHGAYSFTCLSPEAPPFLRYLQTDLNRRGS